MLAKSPKVLKKEVSFTYATDLFPYPLESTRKPLVFYFQRVQKENSGTKYVKETTKYVCTIIHIASVYLYITFPYSFIYSCVKKAVHGNYINFINNLRIKRFDIRILV